MCLVSPHRLDNHLDPLAFLLVQASLLRLENLDVLVKNIFLRIAHLQDLNPGSLDALVSLVFPVGPLFPDTRIVAVPLHHQDVLLRLDSLGSPDTALLNLVVLQDLALLDAMVNLDIQVNKDADFNQVVLASRDNLDILLNLLDLVNQAHLPNSTVVIPQGNQDALAHPYYPADLDNLVHLVIHLVALLYLELLANLLINPVALADQASLASLV